MSKEQERQICDNQTRDDQSRDRKGAAPGASGAGCSSVDLDRSLTVAALNAAEQSHARQQVAKPGLPPPPSGPRAYFITFNCYGTWFHGDSAGSVDRQHNVYGTLVVRPNPGREAAERARTDQPPYELDCVRRQLVLVAIKEVCINRNWWLF